MVCFVVRDAFCFRRSKVYRGADSRHAMKLNVVFLHPDLGIGGAERLVVDAAVALKESGHTVRFVTNHHSVAHCFEETRDGTLPVTVVGDWLPRTVLGRCYALCSYLRMIYAAVYVTFFSSLAAPDVVFVDQVSACVPVLKCRRQCKVVFYCHYPDQLLAARDLPLKRLYRMPLDRLEEATTARADSVLVNSRFTLGVFQRTFRRVQKQPDVLYPSINTAAIDRAGTMRLEDVLPDEDGDTECRRFLLSVNRFERKKNVGLAVQCLALLPDRRIKLVVAGGFDPVNAENAEYFRELSELVRVSNLSDRVVFLKSPSDVAKITLLRHCSCLLYTPANEHFGIVPLEAMYCGKPVVAVNSGGPTETIVDGHNGYLRSAEPKEFADAVKQLLDSDERTKLFGKQGRKRFDDIFSFAAFKSKINGVLENVCKSE